MRAMTILAAACLMAPAGGAEPKAYLDGKCFLGLDYAAGKLHLVDPAGAVRQTWDAPHGNDLWALPGGNLLFNTGHGVREITREGKTVFEYQTKSEVYACQRLADGNTFVGECNAGRLLELRPDGSIAKEVRLLPEGQDGGHLYMRNARRLDNGHYLVAHYGDHRVTEYDGDGKKVWEVPAPSGPHSVCRLPDGHTLFATGDHAKDPRLTEVDKDGKVVWEFSNADLKDAPLKFLAGFQRLPNGHTLITNWLGHGQTGKAPQLYEVTPDKKVVWTYADHEAFKTISTVVVLDEEGRAPAGPVFH